MEKRFGLKRNALRLIGLLLVFFGILSRSILQNKILGVGRLDADQLLEVLSMSGGMQAATTALVLQAMECCAVPIFAVLTIDGFEKSKNTGKYLLRVFLLALICEIPYDFSMTGMLINPACQNPVFAIALCLTMLMLFKQNSGRGLLQVLLKVVVVVVALFWTVIFRIDGGFLMLLTVTILWIFRKETVLRNLLGAAALVGCSMFNPLYMFASLGFLAAHFYNERQNEKAKKLHYAYYPLMLICAAFLQILI